MPSTELQLQLLDAAGVGIKTTQSGVACCTRAMCIDGSIKLDMLSLYMQQCNVDTGTLQRARKRQASFVDSKLECSM